MYHLILWLLGSRVGSADLLIFYYMYMDISHASFKAYPHQVIITKYNTNQNYQFYNVSYTCLLG